MYIYIYIYTYIHIYICSILHTRDEPLFAVYDVAGAVGTRSSPPKIYIHTYIHT